MSEKTHARRPAEARLVCFVCGAVSPVGEPFSYNHVAPVVFGGTDNADNLVAFCHACGSYGATVRELEFITYLAKLMGDHPSYKDVSTQVARRVGAKSIEIDISAKHVVRGAGQPLFIECRRDFVLAGARLERAVPQLKLLDALGSQRVVLAFPGRMSDADKSTLKASGFDVWDRDFVAIEFAEQIRDNIDPIFTPIYGRKPEDSKRNLLRRDLESCETGVISWSKYQKIVGNIVEELFCPPLRLPLGELSDQTKANRRDFVLPNYAESGFWRYMRDAYRADYIVVDAKNSGKRITKRDVLQISSYLKDKGAGLFGIIFSRNGADFGANTTIREHWLMYGKMILVLDDDDVLEMLLESDPTTTLSDRLQDFRLSI